MKYTVTTTIQLPRERVVGLFDDPANLKRWQPTLKSFEPVSGVPGQVGTKSRLRFKDGAREMTLIETVTLRALPDRIAGTYEMPGVWNQVDNRFEAIDADETRWTCEVEFRFDSLPMKLMGWIAPGSFRKQTGKHMDQFKAFAESQTDEGMERTRFEPQ